MRQAPIVVAGGSATERGTGCKIGSTASGVIAGQSRSNKEEPPSPVVSREGLHTIYLPAYHGRGFPW